MTFTEKKKYFQWWIDSELKSERKDNRSFLQGMLFGLQKTCKGIEQQEILQKMYENYLERRAGV